MILGGVGQDVDKPQQQHMCAAAAPTTCSGAYPEGLLDATSGVEDIGRRLRPQPKRPSQVCRRGIENKRSECAHVEKYELLRWRPR